MVGNQELVQFRAPVPGKYINKSKYGMCDDDATYEIQGSDNGDFGLTVSSWSMLLLRLPVKKSDTNLTIQEI